MKTILYLLFASSALALTRVKKQVEGNRIPILSYENDLNFNGNYKYSYQTGNGISMQEEGSLKNPGQKDLEAQTASGSYTYTAPDGLVVTVNWYADETGFHAVGAHLPTPPPLSTNNFRG